MSSCHTGDLVIYTGELNYCKRPCANCPWRKDAEPGEFDAAAFRRLATTAYDNGTRMFQCHKSTDDNPIVCAGFLLRGAEHNMNVRLAYSSGRIMDDVDGDGLDLYDSYRQMAVANGVDPDDPALQLCRD